MSEFEFGRSVLEMTVIKALGACLITVDDGGMCHHHSTSVPLKTGKVLSMPRVTLFLISSRTGAPEVLDQVPNWFFVHF